MSDGPTVERVTALELLHRVCRQHGWALCLISTNDHPTPFKPPKTVPSELAALAVIDPFDQAPVGSPRRHRATRIELGDIVCRCAFDAGANVQTAAGIIVDVLTRGGHDIGAAT